MSKSYDFNEKECKCCHEWWYSSEIKQDLCPNCYDYFKQLKQKLKEKDKQLAEKDIRIEELEGQFAYECECNKQLVELQKQFEEKQNTIDEINKEFVQAVHDWKALCAKKDKEEVVATERGWAGHFILADKCKFRRNTLLEYKDKKWIVSTVGAMPADKYSIDKNENGFTTIGLGRYYETMAFEAQKDGIYWDANVRERIDFDSNWALDECNFNSDQKANEMHDKVVEELIEKLKGE